MTGRGYKALYRWEERSNTPNPLKKLKKFSFDTVFRAGDGAEDKIDLAIGTWRISGSGEAFEQFRDYLGSPPKGLEDMAVGSPWDPGGKHPPAFGWFFTRPQLKGRGAFRLKIRKNPLYARGSGKLKYQSPLCGGYLGFRKGTHEGATCWMATLYLSLNLLRFMRHQPTKEEPSDSDSLTAPPRLRRRGEDRSVFHGEFSFDDEDNWIPDSEAWRQFTTAKNRNVHLLNYVHGIVKRFETDAKRACGHVDVVGSSVDFERVHETISLQKIEHVWEFKSRRPLAEVSRLSQDAIHVASKWGKNDYYSFVGESGRLLNSPCVKVPLKYGVLVKLYSKTNRRIRFEVVQDKISASLATLLKKRHIAIPRNSEKRLDYAQDKHLLSVVRVLREEAADGLNALTKELKRTASPLHPFSAVKLLSNIITSVPEADKKASILSSLLDMLIHQHGIRPGIRNSSIKEAVKRLRERKVIKYDPKLQCDRLTDRYFPAAVLLRSLEGERFASIFGPKKPKSKFRNRTLPASLT